MAIKLPCEVGVLKYEASDSIDELVNDPGEKQVEPSGDISWDCISKHVELYASSCVSTHSSGMFSCDWSGFCFSNHRD